MMDGIKQMHSGKRVNGGTTFNTDKFEYWAADGSMYGLKHWDYFFTTYTYMKYTMDNLSLLYFHIGVENIFMQINIIYGKSFGPFLLYCWKM